MYMIQMTFGQHQDTAQDLNRQMAIFPYLPKVLGMFSFLSSYNFYKDIKLEPLIQPVKKKV